VDDAATSEQPTPPPRPAGMRGSWDLLIERISAKLRQADKSPGTVLWRVRADMAERKQLGMSRYGTDLYPGNGRDSLVDAYQELLDLAVYLENATREHGADLSLRMLRDAVAFETLPRLRSILDRHATDPGPSPAGVPVPPG
jgi:hypothetical protein